MAAKTLRTFASLTTNYTATTIRPERQLYGQRPYSCARIVAKSSVSSNGTTFVKAEGAYSLRIFLESRNRPPGGYLKRGKALAAAPIITAMHAHKPSSTTKAEPCRHSQPPRSNLNLEGSPGKKTTRRWRLPCAAADAAVTPSPSPSPLLLLLPPSWSS